MRILLNYHRNLAEPINFHTCLEPICCCCCCCNVSNPKCDAETADDDEDGDAVDDVDVARPAGPTPGFRPGPPPPPAVDCMQLAQKSRGNGPKSPIKSHSEKQNQFNLKRKNKKLKSRQEFKRAAFFSLRSQCSKDIVTIFWSTYSLLLELLLLPTIFSLQKPQLLEHWMTDLRELRPQRSELDGIGNSTMSDARDFAIFSQTLGFFFPPFIYVFF